MDKSCLQKFKILLLRSVTISNLRLTLLSDSVLYKVILVLFLPGVFQLSTIFSSVPCPQTRFVKAHVLFLSLSLSLLETVVSVLKAADSRFNSDSSSCVKFNPSHQNGHFTLLISHHGYAANPVQCSCESKDEQLSQN